MKLREIIDLVHYTLLSNDEAFNGYVEPLGVNVTCVSPDENRTKTKAFITALNKHNVEILGMWKSKINQPRYMGKFDKMAPQPIDPIGYTIDDSEYEGFIVGLKLGDEVEYIIFSKLCSTIDSVKKFISEIYGLDGSNPERKLAYEVQSIIHQARTRVLGDKYNPDVMYTRLV